MKQWQMIAASIPGPGHLRRGMPCQDAHRVEELPHGGMVVAVADGLGAAPCAEQGAQWAVDVAVTTLQTALGTVQPKHGTAWRQVVRQAFADARATLVALAAAAERPLADYATTLLIAAVTNKGVAIGQVGDGAVVARLAPGHIVTLSKPQRGEFANETRPLTHANAVPAVTAICQPGYVQALALFTDGVQQLCLDAADATPYTPFFAPLFTQICQPLNRRAAEAALIAFLQSERLSKRADDDKTLALLGQVVLTRPR